MRLTAKKSSTFGSHLITGIAVGLRKRGACEIEKWLGSVKRAVKRNWVKVMSRPGHSEPSGHLSQCPRLDAHTAIGFFPSRLLVPATEACVLLATHFTIASRAKTCVKPVSLEVLQHSDHD